MHTPAREAVQAAAAAKTFAAQAPACIYGLVAKEKKVKIRSQREYSAVLYNQRGEQSTCQCLLVNTAKLIEPGLPGAAGRQQAGRLEVIRHRCFG